MLTQEQIDANWAGIKAAIRNLWGMISDEDLERIKGNLPEVVGLIESKYKDTKHDIRQQLKLLYKSFDNDTDKGLSPDHSSYMRSPLGEDQLPVD